MYIYIENRIHRGKALDYYEILTIERQTFLELQEQALTTRNQYFDDKKEITAVVDNREQESEVMRQKDTILKRHNEWRSFYTVISQRCYSKLKCGSANAQPQEPYSSEEIRNLDQEFGRLDKLTDKFKMLSKIGERVNLEYFHHIRYKAYMKGLLTLKIQNFKEDMISSIDSKINEMRSLLANDSKNRLSREYGEELSTEAYLAINTDIGYDNFNEYYAEYKQLKAERELKIKDKRNMENQRYLDR